MADKQVGWSEIRIHPSGETELCFVVAELENEQWKFWERSTWENAWYPMVPETCHWSRLSNEVSQRKKRTAKRGSEEIGFDDFAKERIPRYSEACP